MYFHHLSTSLDARIPVDAVGGVTSVIQRKGVGVRSMHSTLIEINKSNTVIVGNHDVGTTEIAKDNVLRMQDSNGFRSLNENVQRKWLIAILLMSGLSINIPHDNHGQFPVLS